MVNFLYYFVSNQHIFRLSNICSSQQFWLYWKTFTKSSRPYWRKLCENFLDWDKPFKCKNLEYEIVYQTWKTDRRSFNHNFMTKRSSFIPIVSKGKLMTGSAKIPEDILEKWTQWNMCLALLWTDMKGFIHVTQKVYKFEKIICIYFILSGHFQKNIKSLMLPSSQQKPWQCQKMVVLQC